MLLAVLRIFGNYAEIMLASLNFGSYHQNCATRFLSKIKTEQGEERPKQGTNPYLVTAA